MIAVTAVVVLVVEIEAVVAVQVTAVVQYFLSSEPSSAYEQGSVVGLVDEGAKVLTSVNCELQHLKINVILKKIKACFQCFKK